MFYLVASRLGHLRSQCLIVCGSSSQSRHCGPAEGLRRLACDRLDGVQVGPRPQENPCYPHVCCWWVSDGPMRGVAGCSSCFGLGVCKLATGDSFVVVFTAEDSVPGGPSEQQNQNVHLCSLEPGVAVQREHSGSYEGA